MKKFVLAAVAASLIASPAIAAPQGHGSHGGPGYNGGNPRGMIAAPKAKPAPVVQYRKWQKGQRFDSRYARNYRQIDYRKYRGLKAPPRGYRYVQSGNDAVLVSVTSGLIAAVLANILR